MPLWRAVEEVLCALRSEKPSFEPLRIFLKIDITVLPNTVWKFQDFSLSQILREITFGILEVQKIAIFAF